MDSEIIKWLMLGDPSIQFQTARDLLDITGEELVVLQEPIQYTGWGSKFLSFQEDSGIWGGGFYSPKWISTHYTLMTLMELGLPENNSQAKKGVKTLLEHGFYKDGGINHWKSQKHSETCVSAMTLALLIYFEIDDPRVERVKEFLLNQQMEDGGWNCQRFNGATHSSFHTTIMALEALHFYEKKTNSKDAELIKKATTEAHEFLLQHHLFKSHKTQAIVDRRMTLFSFPPRWKYDVMRSLDYFQKINMPHDPRFCDAITLLRKKEKQGKWPLQNKHSGQMFFEMEKTGQPSRMNTLRALRILKWWMKKPKEVLCKV